MTTVQIVPKESGPQERIGVQIDSGRFAMKRASRIGAKEPRRHAKVVT